MWKLSYKMKKYRLEDIKKDRVLHEPPAGYFDKLPGIIQAKTAHKTTNRRRTYLIGALRLVPAAAAVALIVYYTGIFGPDKGVVVGEVEEVMALLEEVPAEEVIEYLATIDLTTEEILEEVDINELSFEFQEEQDDNLLENLELDDASLIELYGDLAEDESLL